jgi:aspartate aminotransferase
MPGLAQRMSAAKPSAIMQVAEKAKKLKAEGRDIISFSIGVPNFLPEAHVYEAAREALAKDSGNYGSNRGTDALLDAYLAHLKGFGIEGYTRSNVSTGIGAKHVLFNLMYAMLNEGDEVLIPTPYWTSYLDIADILGAESKLLPCPAAQNYKLTPEQLAAAISPKSKVLLLNNPSNPTGMVYSEAEVRALADVLVQHPNLWVIADDIYNRMLFDGQRYFNLVQARPELRDRVVIMDSLSKTYGMPGWRVGFACGPKEIADALTTLNSNHITNIPEITTAAAIAALSGSQAKPTEMCAAFANKRDLVMNVMNAIPGIVCPRPQGAFYVFPDISFAFGKRFREQVIADDVAFCNALLEAYGVACVPGRAFGEPLGLRISYTCKDAELVEGLRRFQAFCAELA